MPAILPAARPSQFCTPSQGKACKDRASASTAKPKAHCMRRRAACCCQRSRRSRQYNIRASPAVSGRPMESVISVEVPPAVPPYPGPTGLNSCTRYVPWFWILPISGPLTISLIFVRRDQDTGRRYQALSATASSAALTQASRRAGLRVSRRRSRQNTTSSSADQLTAEQNGTAPAPPCQRPWAPTGQSGASRWYIYYTGPPAPMAGK